MNRTFHDPSLPIWLIWEVPDPVDRFLVVLFRVGIQAWISNLVWNGRSMCSKPQFTDLTYMGGTRSAVSEDPSELLPLTPRHFLRGAPLNAPLETPEDSPRENDISHLRRWKRFKVIQHKFSKRWKSEYLVEMQIQMENSKKLFKRKRFCCN